MVPLLNQDLLDPRVNLLSGFVFEADAGAGFENRLDLFQVQLLCFVHDGGQSSSCHPLQAHLALESHLPFRLILYWIRLSIETLALTCHSVICFLWLRTRWRKNSANADYPLRLFAGLGFRQPICIP